MRDWVICELWSRELQLRVSSSSCELQVASWKLQVASGQNEKMKISSKDIKRYIKVRSQGRKNGLFREKGCCDQF